MHEFSVASEIIGQCRQILADQGHGRRPERVRLRIGVLSGIEPDLLDLALAELKRETEFAEAEFTREIDPAQIWCRVCQKIHQVREVAFHCPVCFSPAVEIRSGRDLMILSLDLVADQEPVEDRQQDQSQKGGGD